MILSINENVVTRDERILVKYDKSRSTLGLTIIDVQERDTGVYMCQINTDPMISKKAYLNVLSKLKD